MIKTPHGIGTASDTGENGIWQPPFLLLKLLLDLLGNHRLEIADNRREGMRSHHRTEAVMGIANPGRPLAHGLGYRVFEGRRTGLHRDDPGAKEPHTVHIERLANRIFLPHENHTFHPHHSGGRRGCYTMLAGSRLGNQTSLPHLLGKQRLPQHIVDLMRTCMIEIFSL